MRASARAVVATLAAFALACGGRAPSPGTAGGVPWSADPAAWRATLPVGRERLGVGTAADSARIAAWDVDVDTLGHGLPAGRGTARDGAPLYQTKCAMCHGAAGEGLPPLYPALVAAAPRPAFDFAADPTVVRTIGNYWPYATTLFDYLQRAMPYTAPGSLTADETYALTAYLLAANGLVPDTLVLDARTLPQVRMPGAGRFVDDDRGRR